MYCGIDARGSDARQLDDRNLFEVKSLSPFSRLISSVASSASQRPFFALLRRATARKGAEAPFSDIFQPASVMHETPKGRRDAEDAEVAEP